MGINLGSSEIGDVKLGSSQVSAVYQGTNLLWPLASGIEIIDSKILTPADGDFSMDLTDLTFANGDVAMFFFCADVGDTAWSLGPQVWRTIADSASSDPFAFVAVRRMTGFETVLESSSGNAFVSSSMAIVIFRGIQLPIAGDVTTDAAGTTGMPNPNPRSDFVSGDWCLAVGYLDDDSIVMTPPTDYTTIETANNYSSSLAVTYRDDPAATEDPSVFGGGGNDAWRAYTIRLMPSIPVTSYSEYVNFINRMGTTGLAGTALIKGVLRNIKSTSLAKSGDMSGSPYKGGHPGRMNTNAVVQRAVQHAVESEAVMNEQVSNNGEVLIEINIGPFSTAPTLNRNGFASFDSNVNQSTITCYRTMYWDFTNNKVRESIDMVTYQDLVP